MDLNDLKEVWQNVNNHYQSETMNPPQPATNQPSKMKKYNAILKVIVYPEILGVIMCLLAAAFLIIEFERLDSLIFQVLGVITAALLESISILSLVSLKTLRPSTKNLIYIQPVSTFLQKKILFTKLQRVNLILCHILLVILFILLPKLFGKTSYTISSATLITSLALGYVFLIFYSKWVFRAYNRVLKRTENLLEDLSSH